MKPALLETACALYSQEAKTNPFNTWLIVENEDVRHRAFELIKTPVLQTRITTIKTLAHTILKEQNAGIRIIPPKNNTSSSPPSPKKSSTKNPQKPKP